MRRAGRGVPPFARFGAGSALAALLSGCSGDQAVLCAAAPPAAVAAARTATADAPVARSQKPDESRPPAVKQTVFEAVNQPFTGPPDNAATVRVRARVNGVAILDEEVRAASLRVLMALPPDERVRLQNEVVNRELQKIIDRELILDDVFKRLQKNKPQYLERVKDAAHKEFEKHLRTMKANVEKAGLKVKTKDDWKKFFLSQGMTFEGYQREFERNFMSMEYLRSRIFPLIQNSVGHQEIVEYYEQHAREFESFDKVHWQDIFIDSARYQSREEAGSVAAQVAARARAGEDFLELIRQYDHGDSSFRNGAAVVHLPGEVRPVELEPVLFGMKEGDVGPVIEVPNGFHVVRLTKREHAGRKPLDEELQTQIRRKLQNLMAERESNRIMNDLRRRASIEIANDMGR